MQVYHKLWLFGTLCDIDNIIVASRNSYEDTIYSSRLNLVNYKQT